MGRRAAEAGHLVIFHREPTRSWVPVPAASLHPDGQDTVVCDTMTDTQWR